MGHWIPAFAGMTVWHENFLQLVLLQFRNFLEEDALAGVVFWVEWEFVVMVFVSVDDVFGEAEPVGPPGRSVRRNRAYEKVACPTFDDIIAELDTKVVYRYLNDKLALLMRILHRPKARLVNSFTAHLHRHSGCPSRLQFYSTDTGYRGGNFAVRLEDEFPAAFFCFPCTDEKIRELPDAVDCDFYAVAGRAPAAGKHNGKKYPKQQENISFHNTNFRRLRYMLQ